MILQGAQPVHLTMIPSFSIGFNRYRAIPTASPQQS
jgi:hypothetical protein